MIIRLLVAMFMIFSIAKSALSAQPTITEADGYSCMGDDKSRKQTEQAAMLDAKKNAAEYTSTYIKSETQVKDFALQKDLVSAYANADVRIIEDLEKGWYKDPSSGDCFKIKIKAEVTPDEKAMEKLSQASGTADQGNSAYPVAPPPIVANELSSHQDAAGPDIVVVPSGETYVYMLPNTTGVYFYGGYWYRYYEGYWFRSPNYARNWGIISPVVVPRVVVNVPPEYPRYLPPAYYRIHYGDFHQHWQAWDRDREWHKRDWFKAEMRPDVGMQRQALINQEREQHRAKVERQRQEAQQQLQQQERQRIKADRERREARQQSLQQKKDRAKIERKRQMAQLKAQRDRKIAEKNKLKKEKSNHQKQDRHE